METRGLRGSQHAKGGPYGTTSPPGRTGWKFHLYSIGSLVFVPSLIFDIVNIMFALLSHRHLGIVIFISFLCAFVALLIGLAGHWNRMGPFYYFVSVLSFLAIANGAWVGGLNNMSNWAQYWTYKYGATYTNVAPVEPAAGYIDAGLIGFTSGSLVDSQQALGVNVPQGFQYCVAPVFDESQQRRAEFWAVGLNCCESRLGFFCDDASNMKAKSGLVLPNTNHMFSSYSLAPYYEAVKQAAATYGLEIPDTPLLVRWADDAEAIANASWTSGVMWLVSTCIFYFCLSGFAGVVLHAMSRKGAA